MDCGCAYVDTSYDSVEVLEQKVIIARKDHKCNVCGRKINKNEQYERVKGVYDGFFTNKTCIDCLSIRNAFFCEVYYYEFLEDLQYHLEDIGGQVKSECLESLTPTAKIRIINMIDELWDNT